MSLLYKMTELLSEAAEIIRQQQEMLEMYGIEEESGALDRSRSALLSNIDALTGGEER